MSLWKLRDHYWGGTILPYGVGGNKLVVFLALSGISSGLVTCAFMPPGEDVAGLYCGVVFGLLLAGPLVISRILDSLLRALGLIAVSTAAYFFAYSIAFWVQLDFPQIVPSAERWSMSTYEPASPIALFIGGLVGGLLIFAGLVFLSRSEIRKGTRARKILQGALIGAILAVVAWALRSSVGTAAWHLFHVFGLTPPWELSPMAWFGGKHDYGERTRMYSLYIVWQTGIAAAVGIMFRNASNRKEEKSNDLHLLKS